MRGREAHLYLNGPREVANIDKERDVGAVAEVEVLVGEAVLELLDVAPGDDGDLLPGLGAGWRAERRTEREREGGRVERKKKEGGTDCLSIPVRGTNETWLLLTIRF